MVVEMAGSYTILPAAMLSIFIAYVATGKYHIYREQLPSRIQSPAHRNEYRAYFLSEISVGAIARQDSEPVPPSMTVREALDRAVRHAHPMLSVEQDGEWFGGVRLRDLVGVPLAQREELRCLDLVRPLDLAFASDLPSLEALRRMDELDEDVAVVVTAEGPVRVLGLVTRRGIRHPTLDAASQPSGEPPTPADAGPG
jgi:CIC family chloride channel protein